MNRCFVTSEGTGIPRLMKNVIFNVRIYRTTTFKKSQPRFINQITYSSIIKIYVINIAYSDYCTDACHLIETQSIYLPDVNFK